MDWDKTLKDLKKLGDEGKLKMSEDMAPELRKVMFNAKTGKIEEQTISPKLKEAILKLRKKGE